MKDEELDLLVEDREVWQGVVVRGREFKESSNALKQSQ